MYFGTPESAERVPPSPRCPAQLRCVESHYVGIPLRAPGLARHASGVGVLGRRAAPAQARAPQAQRRGATPTCIHPLLARAPGRGELVGSLLTPRQAGGGRPSDSTKTNALSDVGAAVYGFFFDHCDRLLKEKRRRR
eukprot:9301577-Alexandrium_andersonii.AAC.1